jgi:hypothetical protein
MAFVRVYAAIVRATTARRERAKERTTPQLVEEGADALSTPS